MPRSRSRFNAAGFLVLLIVAGCGSTSPGAAGGPTTDTTSSSGPAAPDPKALAATAPAALSALDGFTVTGVLPYEAGPATVVLAVGRHTGHGTVATAYGTVTIDWSDAAGGLFLTAPASFWAVYSDSPDLADRQVSVPSDHPLARLQEYVDTAGCVPRIFRLLAGSPHTIAAAAAPTGAAWAIDYDVSGSQLTVLAGDSGLPVRLRSSGGNLTFGSFGAVPQATTPTDGGVPFAG